MKLQLAILKSKFPNYNFDKLHHFVFHFSKSHFSKDFIFYIFLYMFHWMDLFYKSKNKSGVPCELLSKKWL